MFDNVWEFGAAAWGFSVVVALVAVIALHLAGAF